jgi:hypothetical protein
MCGLTCRTLRTQIRQACLSIPIHLGTPAIHLRHGLCAIPHDCRAFGIGGEDTFCEVPVGRACLAVARSAGLTQLGQLPTVPWKFRQGIAGQLVSALALFLSNLQQTRQGLLRTVLLRIARRHVCLLRSLLGSALVIGKHWVDVSAFLIRTSRQQGHQHQPSDAVPG